MKKFTHDIRPWLACKYLMARWKLSKRTWKEQWNWLMEPAIQICFRFWKWWRMTSPWTHTLEWMTNGGPRNGWTRWTKWPGRRGKLSNSPWLLSINQSIMAKALLTFWRLKTRERRGSGWWCSTAYMPTSPKNKWWQEGDTLHVWLNQKGQSSSWGSTSMSSQSTTTTMMTLLSRHRSNTP